MNLFNQNADNEVNNVSKVLTEFTGWVYELSATSGYFTKVCPKVVYQTERIANIYKMLFFYIITLWTHQGMYKIHERMFLPLALQR